MCENVNNNHPLLMIPQYTSKLQGTSIVSNGNDVRTQTEIEREKGNRRQHRSGAAK